MPLLIVFLLNLIVSCTAFIRHLLELWVHIDIFWLHLSLIARANTLTKTVSSILWSSLVIIEVCAFNRVSPRFTLRWCCKSVLPRSEVSIIVNTSTAISIRTVWVGDSKFTALIIFRPISPYLRITFRINFIVECLCKLLSIIHGVFTLGVWPLFSLLH